MSPAEWRACASQLRMAAERSDGNPERPTKAVLVALAEFYEDNAMRVAAGMAPLWPPPGFSELVPLESGPVDARQRAWCDDGRE